MPAKGGLTRSPPVGTPISMTSGANSVPVDVYNLVTLPRLDHSATPTGRNIDGSRKRSRTDFAMHDAPMENLEAKLDAITASIARSDEHIKHLLDDNKRMHNELAEIKGLIQTFLSVKPSSSAAPAPAPSTSYANALKSSDVVIVKPISTQPCKTTRDALVKAVNPVESGVRGVKDGHNGKIVIECNSKADSEKVKLLVDSALGEGYKVNTPKRRLPIVRLYGLRNDLPEADFLDALRKQNPKLFVPDSSVRVLRKFEVKNTRKSDGPRFGFKIEVDPGTFKLMIEADNVSVGWDKLWVNEEFLLVRCFNCWGFHHTSKTCSSNKICAKCAETHDDVPCKSSVEKCCVCSAFSLTSGLGINVNHSARSLLCPSYLNKIELEKRTINYT